MNSLIQVITDIKWLDRKSPLKEEDLWLIKKQIPFNLPKDFIDLLKISDGGYIEYDFFYRDVFDNSITGSGITIIYGAKENGFYDLLYNYYDPPEGFPKNLVAFAGDSDQICFDYRTNPKTDNPPVVYWNFESPEGEDISPLADNFMEFLKILIPPLKYIA